MDVITSVPRYDTQGPANERDWTTMYNWLVNLRNTLNKLLGNIQGVTLNKAFAFNFAFDAPGAADSRPTTWGTTAFVDSPITFTAVPAGKRVQILRFTGVEYIFMNGSGGTPPPIVPTTLPAGSALGFLWGLITTTTKSGSTYTANNALSPDVDPGSGANLGCPMFFQGGISAENPCATVPFDLDLASNENSILDANNTLLVRQAWFLNNTGVPPHMEIAGTIEYQYVAA